ncbi:MAG: TPM domain-containing protein [Sphingobacteriaceae bacterium]|nr:TPM domain-containing protein [Sphingobacteriaceae bacterium]
MILKKLSFLIAFLFLTSLYGFAQEFPAKPNPPRLVNDFTNTLSQDEINHLERKLVAFNDSTSIQIAIVLMQSIGVYEVDSYTAQLAEKWGVGEKGKNNGIVILAALKDRKLSIQTGYGLEGALPDGAAANIRLNEINPRFREGDYFGGLDKATDAIIAYTKGEYKNDKPKSQSKKSNKFPTGLIIIIIAVIFILSRKGGGGGGKGGQIIGSRGGSSLFWGTLMSGMGNRGGSGFGGGGFGGGGGGFGGGGGGFGGGSGGFGGGGGGFGGFGGGSFGGGGSGGSW